MKPCKVKPEFNAVTGSVILVSSICLEALGLLPVSTATDVPCTMRCSALVLIALLGADIVGARSNANEARVPVGDHALELEQRLILILSLLVVSGLGERSGEKEARAADAIFVLVAGCVMVFLFARHVKKTPACALFGALLSYSGTRIVSHALSHSSEVVEFTVSRENLQSLGYALSDSVASTALVFGGCCCACCGICVLANDKLIQSKGSQELTPAVLQIAALVFSAAFVAQLSMYASIDALPVIFEESSCRGGDCHATERARRFFISNLHCGPLWATCVSMVVFCFPHTNYTCSSPTLRSSMMAISVSTIVLLGMYHFSGGQDSMTELILIYLSIPVAWFASTGIGCAFFTAGNLMYIRTNLQFDSRFFTHWSVAFSTTIGVLLLATTSAIVCLELMYMRCALLERATAGLTIALLSVQLALTLLTLALFASYDGSFVGTTISFRETGFEWASRIKPTQRNVLGRMRKAGN